MNESNKLPGILMSLNTNKPTKKNAKKAREKVYWILR